MRLIPLQNSIIYGPVRSKRLGRSLGINLFPADQKICSFDCIYCHFGKTTDHTRVCDCPDVGATSQSRNVAPLNDVLTAVEASLRSEVEYDFITLSGNGEPTMYPDFVRLIPELLKLIRRYRPSVRLALLSNSTTVTDASRDETLRLLDRCIFKLDVGDQRTLEAINHPCPGIRIEEIIQGLTRLARKLRLVIQTALIDGSTSNWQGEAFENLLKALLHIQPAEVQLYTTDRPMADQTIRRLTDEQLQRAAQTIRDRTGLNVVAYY